MIFAVPVSPLLILEIILKNNNETFLSVRGFSD